MKKLTKSILALLLSVTFLPVIAACNPSDSGNNGDDDTSHSEQELPIPGDRGGWTVASPDGEIKADLKMDSAGELTYSVKKGDLTVVEQSKLGFDIKEDDFRIVTVEGANAKRITGSYNNKSGKHAKVEYDCNELTLTLKAYEFYLDVIMRAYDDGYAFRYNIRAIDGGEGTITVESENSEIAVPVTSAVWAQTYVSINNKGNFFAYENPYVRRVASNLATQYLSMPFLYQLKGTDVYSLVTESDLVGSGYYGSFLKEAEENEGTGIFKTEHTPAGCTPNDNVISYPFTSPWRLGITGDMKTVIESELAEKVFDNAEYWKPDNYDELSEEDQEIYTYDWVEPGVVAWNWLVETSIGKNTQRDWPMQKTYVDLAHDMGWKYILLDANWDREFDEDKFRDFMDYADSKDIKVLVWCNALNDFANGNLPVLCSKLDKWAKFGIAGIKIDFFDGQSANNPTHQGEDIGTIKWYESIYQECAKRKMVVNCHGANKPTGERRIYPNVLTREGIYGNEFTTVDATATVNSLFTRAVIGPSDFTPVVKPLSKGLTMGHEMALAALYEAGLPSMADYASTYRDELISDYYKAVSALKDETLFLCGEPDGYYCAAVRCGDDWIVAGVNSILKTTTEIDFSFLGEGTYVAEYFEDVADDNTAVTKTTKTITKDSKEEVTMLRNGGFVYHLKKQA